MDSVERTVETELNLVSTFRKLSTSGKNFIVLGSNVQKNVQRSSEPKSEL